jgi:hypothetical protein
VTNAKISIGRRVLIDSELFGRDGRGIVAGFGGENHETDFIADLEIVACCSRLFADR